MRKMNLAKLLMFHVPIAHSTTVHNINHLGSGMVALPRPSTPSCITRSVAKAMQIKPLPNKTKIPIFCLLGIWRFQVKRMGRNMTGSVIRVVHGCIKLCWHTCEVSSHIYCIRKVEAEDDPLVFVWCTAAFSFRKFSFEIIARKHARDYTAEPRL